MDHPWRAASAIASDDFPLAVAPARQTYACRVPLRDGASCGGVGSSMDSHPTTVQSASADAAKSILHIDMDCFYVSVERLRDPALNGRPVAVGGSPDGRGVVASASYEARVFGVRSAMAMGAALRLCPHLIVIRGTYSRYAEVAARINEILLSFTPLVEMASQDEAYLDLTGTERLWGAGALAADRIRRRVAEETRLPCSVGIGANRTIAKIASGLAKPSGLLWVPGGSEAAFLRNLPVESLPGVGERTRERLRSLGILRVGDLAAADEGLLRRHLGEHGIDLVRRARGEGSTRVEPEREAKSIGAEETFDTDTADAEYLHAVLSALCERVAFRLRQSGRHAQTVTVKLRYTNFETHTVAQTLEAPINDEVRLFEAARALLENRRDPGRPLRLVGVTASGLCDGPGQLDLIANADDSRRLQTQKAVDALRKKHGFSAIRRASSIPGTGPTDDERWG